jgi:methylated-DNA-[protein]-cysteine S-methyltransferase
MTFHNQIQTPFGPVHTTVNAAGALLALRFAPYDGPIAPEATAWADREILEYCRGERQTFTVPVEPPGTDFQRTVWAMLREIPFGTTRSYGELARELGKPNAARAVGRANATNPVALVVPCHRVIGSSGALTGFAYGVEIKRQLLTFEGVNRDLGL